jgi:ankyrin repeat protein
LIEKCGADVNAYFNGSALPWSASNGNLDIVKLLLKHGADINAWAGEALLVNVAYGRLEFVEFLIEHGADVHINHDQFFKLSAYHGHLEVFKLLFQYITDIDAIKSALIRGVEMEHSNIVEFLIKECEADIRANNDEAFIAKYLDNI